jgi:hypothetical protein
MTDRKEGMGGRRGMGQDIFFQGMLPVAYLLHLCPTSYFSPSYYESMKELIH